MQCSQWCIKWQMMTENTSKNKCHLRLDFIFLKHLITGRMKCVFCSNGSTHHCLEVSGGVDGEVCKDTAD